MNSEEATHLNTSKGKFGISLKTGNESVIEWLFCSIYQATFPGYTRCLRLIAVHYILQFAELLSERIANLQMSS